MRASGKYPGPPWRSMPDLRGLCFEEAKADPS